MTKRALIVDEGRERSSLAAARALVSAGWTVGAASSRPNLASGSRAIAGWHHVAHTDEGDEAFASSLDGVVSSHGYEAVFVVWDRAVAVVSERRSELGFAVGYGPHEGVLAAMDKEHLAPLARAAGLEVPRMIAIDRADLEALAGRAIIKPASHVECQMAARAVEDPAQAIAYADAIVGAGGRAIAQERLDGMLMAVSLVAGPEGIVTIAQQVAELTWPQPIGITARGVSVAVDPGLRTAIERLLDRLAWQGLAHMQFIVPADGRPRLIDFNTRFYGSLPLAIRAGANHPDAWARVATGRPVQASVGRPGARYQWLSRDLRASWSSPHRYRETVRCGRVSLAATHNLWSRQDPTLAPRFLAGQVVRASKRRLPAPPGSGNARASAALHGLPPTFEVSGPLRARRVPSMPARATQRVLMKAGRLTYEDAWLRPLQAVRRRALGDAALGAPRLLVRVDEFPYYSGFDEPKVGYQASERFHAVMAEAGVPHLMSVVPQWTHEPLRPAGTGGRSLDDRDRELLDRMRRDGVTFAQHGATHRTRRSDPRRQSELCGLDNAALEALLSAGKRNLEAAGVHPRILVPPFNRFDAGQWPLLSERYDVVTGGPESVRLMGFHGGPLWRGQAVYLPCYAPLYDRAAAVLPAVERLIAEQIGTWIPVVLHMGWEVEDDYAALRRLASRIAPYAASWESFLADLDATRRRLSP